MDLDLLDGDDFSIDIFSKDYTLNLQAIDIMLCIKNYYQTWKTSHESMQATEAMLSIKDYYMEMIFQDEQVSECSKLKGF